MNAFFKSKNNWDWNKPYLFEINKPIEPIEEVTPDNAASNGSYWQKAAYYETANEPSSLNWKTYFTISDYGLMGWKTTDGVQLSLKNKLPIAVKGGTFIIDINYRLSGDWNAAECIVTSDEQYYDGKYSTGFTDTMLKCKTCNW